jgi:hypothetical protein
LTWRYQLYVAGCGMGTVVLGSQLGSRQNLVTSGIQLMGLRNPEDLNHHLKAAAISGI